MTGQCAFGVDSHLVRDSTVPEQLGELGQGGSLELVPTLVEAFVIVDLCGL